MRLLRLRQHGRWESSVCLISPSTARRLRAKRVRRFSKRHARPTSVSRPSVGLKTLAASLPAASALWKSKALKGSSRPARPRSRTACTSRRIRRAFSPPAKRRSNSLFRSTLSSVFPALKTEAANCRIFAAKWELTRRPSIRLPPTAPSKTRTPFLNMTPRSACAASAVWVPAPKAPETASCTCSRPGPDFRLRRRSERIGKPRAANPAAIVPRPARRERSPKNSAATGAVGKLRKSSPRARTARRGVSTTFW